MKIEPTYEQILEAMRRFDNELRDSWGVLDTSNNIIDYNGLLYPIRQIVSMASHHSSNFKRHHQDLFLAQHKGR